MASYSFFFLAFVALFLQTYAAQAQDTLYLTNGTVVLTKGIHVKGDSLYYTFANDTATTLATPVSEAAFMYSHLGTRYAYNKAYSDMVLTPRDRWLIARELGKDDFLSAKTGVFWLGFVGGLGYGLPIAAFGAITKPKPTKYYHAEPAKMAENAFAKGYQRGLYSKKRSQMALGLIPLATLDLVAVLYVLKYGLFN